MNKETFKFKVGFLKLHTTTVDTGSHFNELRSLIETMKNDTYTISINCNKWLLEQMLELESQWDDCAKQKHLLLYNQLQANLAS